VVDDRSIYVRTCLKTSHKVISVLSFTNPDVMLDLLKEVMT